MLLTSIALQLALLTGQSNACLLSPHLPLGSHALVCSPGQSITSWAEEPGNLMADATRVLLDQRPGGPPWQVVVWWQGESDAGMPPAEYAARMITALTRVAVRPDGSVLPIMLVEVAQRPGREGVTAVHRWLATHPAVAFIPTGDLERDGTGDHFTSGAYAVVVQRLGQCLAVGCWRE